MVTGSRASKVRWANGVQRAKLPALGIQGALAALNSSPSGLPSGCAYRYHCGFTRCCSDTCRRSGAGALDLGGQKGRHFAGAACKRAARALGACCHLHAPQPACLRVVHGLQPPHAHAHVSV